jgi:hypothetical protein
MSTTEVHRKAVIGYLQRSVAVIPVPAGEKNPGYDGWQDLRLTSEDVPCYWTNGQNIGALNGEPSGWRVCVDLDVSEALGIAGRFLPPTLTSGRESSQHSHWWYVALGARNKKFKDLDGSVLLELRSTGCQTLVAPSVHPTGEKYIWHSENGLEVADADSSDLEARCAELATATLVVRHLPEHRTSGGGGGTTTRWPWPAFCCVPDAWNKGCC